MSILIEFNIERKIARNTCKIAS